jgi:hypothetical protein
MGFCPHYVDISTVILNGSVEDHDFWVGRLVFRAKCEVSGSVVRLVEASLGSPTGIDRALAGAESRVNLTIRGVPSFEKLAESFGAKEG